MSVVSRFRLDGRVALVSGAGRGIGASSALALAEAGADVAVLARDEQELESTAAKARASGARALALPTDVSDPDAVARAVSRTVEELGGLDVVVSVTGGSAPRPFLETGDDELRDSYERNVLHGIRLVRDAVPHLVSSEAASVVMISSAIGHVVGRGYLAYGSAKASLEHAVRLLAAELDPKVRINAVAPGAIRTESLEQVAADPAIKETLERNTPLRRLGEPEDIASAVLYLASRASSYVTGQTLAVDGGVVSSNLPMPFPDL